MTNLDSILKSRDITLPKKGPSSKNYGFSSNHVWMWELNDKESWALKNWCFWTVVLEKTLESPLDCKEIQPVHSKGDQSWLFIERTDAKAETPILWPPHANSWLIGKDWCWEGLGAAGEGDDRRWDSWMASLTRWTWVWASSSSWWWTGKPGMLQSMGSQRMSNWTELNWWYIHTMKHYSAIEVKDLLVLSTTLGNLLGASLVGQMVKNLPTVKETWFNPWVRKIPWRREW